MLSKEKIEQIRNGAKDFYNNAEEGHDQDYYSGLIVGYKAGATAEAEKAQCLIEALEKLLPIANLLCFNCCPGDFDLSGYYLADKALQSYTNSLK